MSAPAVRCPHLSLIYDNAPAEFATDAHRCHAPNLPTRIAAAHQERYCLTPAFTDCIVYQGGSVEATRGEADIIRNAGAQPPSFPRVRPDLPRVGVESRGWPVRHAAVCDDCDFEAEADSRDEAWNWAFGHACAGPEGTK